MGNTALPLDEGIDLFDGLQKSRVAVRDDQLKHQLKLSPSQTSSLDFGKKASPGGLIFHVRELKGEDLFKGLLISRSFAVDTEGREHHFFLDTNLPDFLGDSIEDEELNRVRDGLVFETLKLFVQPAECITQGLSADLFAEKNLGNALELAGTDSVAEQSADGCINILASAFISVKDTEFNTPFIYARDLDICYSPELG
jgi:hypothetical protein